MEIIVRGLKSSITTVFKIDLIVWKWDKEVTEHYIIIEFKIDLIVWKSFN